MMVLRSMLLNLTEEFDKYSEVSIIKSVQNKDVLGNPKTFFFDILSSQIPIPFGLVYERPAASTCRPFDLSNL